MQEGSQSAGTQEHESAGLRQRVEELEAEVARLQRAAARRRNAGDSAEPLEASGSWRSLANALPQFVWAAQSFGEAQFINDFWYEYTGLPRGELSPASWLTVLHPEDVPHIAEMWQRALSSGSEQTFEYRVKRVSDGMWRWHRGFHRPERDGSGKIVRWIGNAFEIDDLKLTQQALRDTEERRRLAIEASGAGLWDWEIANNLVSWNERIYEMHGLPPGSFDGTLEGFTSTVHPGDVERVNLGLRKALEQDEPYRVEFRVIWPDGAVRWLSTSARVVRDESGGAVRMLGATLDITERKVAEDAVRRSEERFRAIVNTSPECVKLVAADGTLLQMNPAGLEMVGAKLDEDVIGKSIYSLIAPEFRDSFRAFHEAVCRGERGFLEFDIVGMHGRRRHMESHAAPLRNPDGKVVQLAITRDVTQRRERERAALLLSAIVDSSDDAIVSKDLNGIVTSWNQGAERVFGYTAAEMVGQSITVVIPAERLSEEPEILARLRRGERVDHFETVRRRKDGTLIDVSLTISPMRDQQGNIIGASKIARDITESKRAEAALLASEARFRQLAEAMPQMVWTAHPDGEVDYYNERWYQFTGFRRGQGDRSWQPVQHPDDLKRGEDTWRASVRTGEPYLSEFRFWDGRENRWRWFMGRALPVRGEDGRIAKWFGTFTDIDEQKRVEDELRRANQDLEQFAYSASHDLQEPLRTIKIYGELLSRRYAHRLDGEALEFLGYLKNGATRMESLVRDLLAYTRVVQLEPPKESTDANEMMAQAISDLSGAIRECGATVTFDPLPAVRVRGPHLAQLFQNLIGNAIKYRDPGRAPRVHVSGDRKNGDWVFSVRDNGIGIEPEYKEQIFGLFKRLHNGDEYSGTGIGLAICQRIVERYQGRIWVESEPGQGSEFVFTIPVG